MGGAPLAEHGVGRSALKQQMLLDLYGERGIEEMRAVKRALDPEWKLAPVCCSPNSDDFKLQFCISHFSFRHGVLSHSSRNRRCSD